MCFEVYQHLLTLQYNITDLISPRFKYTRALRFIGEVITLFCNHIENEIFLHLTNIYLNVEFESKLSKSKEHRIASKDRT